jgi:hypothetical protein
LRRAVQCNADCIRSALKPSELVAEPSIFFKNNVSICDEQCKLLAEFSRFAFGALGPTDESLMCAVYKLDARLELVGD